jgi:hypothetical protein
LNAKYHMFGLIFKQGHFLTCAVHPSPTTVCVYPLRKVSDVRLQKSATTYAKARRLRTHFAGPRIPPISCPAGKAHNTSFRVTRRR